MKKIAFCAAAALTMLTGCNGDKLKQAETENAELRGDLQETLATQDSLFSLLNEISDGMAQIKDLEKIVSAPVDLSAESQSRKEQIRQDMQTIQLALRDRRQRLEALEAKLKEQGAANEKHLKTIQSLKNQIAEQQNEIAGLTEKLAQANIQIEQLDGQVKTLNTAVDSLNTGLNSERAERAQAEQAATRATNELNECFYAIGSKDELRKQKILETGFLRKTKIMKGDFDQSYFTTGDKRTLTTISLHSKKAKVLTSQPADSYTIDTTSDGSKILRITNPAKFWQLTNYLVVQID
nr:hypothetical protein [Bacteroides sp.]